jgi:Sodium:sulfate symporter transmembrane region
MAEPMRDGGGTGVEQAERVEAAAEREQPEQPVEAERRPTDKTLDEQQGRLTEGRGALRARAADHRAAPSRSTRWSRPGGHLRSQLRLHAPVSTPPNAIVYSSGVLPITRMDKTGAVFDVIGAVLCVVAPPGSSRPGCCGGPGGPRPWRPS